jgi:hypothetical protein
MLLVAVLLSTLACDGVSVATRTPASAPVKAVAQEASLKIVYVRSGGFAGFNDALEISGDSLTLTRRKKLVTQRKLSDDEQRSLRHLVDAAIASPAPGQVGAPGADTMQITVTVGDAATPQLTAIGHNLPPKGLPPAWDQLVQKLKGLFDQALAAP